LDERSKQQQKKRERAIGTAIKRESKTFLAKMRTGKRELGKKVMLKISLKPRSGGSKRIRNCPCKSTEKKGAGKRPQRF